ELPNKIGLGRDDYFTVQQIYRGWAIPGAIFDPGALITTLILTVLVRHERRHFALALIAFLCIAGTLAVFFTFTFPVNQATDNWTALPQDWQRLRAQWEYSHAAGAGLTLVAFAALALSAAARD
ncbi:MAG: DUF1772 domain-containing protein, partial [Geminicoccales bacterium]